MTALDELTPKLRALSRADKLKAMRLLLDELAEEEATLFEATRAYPVWSPYESYDAASQLLAALSPEDRRA